MEQIHKEYDAVKDLSVDIRRMQRKMRTSSIKMSLNSKSQQAPGSYTNNYEEDIKKTVVLEPEDIIFTILDYELEDSTPNLIFEQKNSEGELVTQYMYMNQSFKPFLIFLWKTFDVIIYSRLKIGLLNQLLNQIKTMWPEINFLAILGSNSWFNAKLMTEEQNHERDENDFTSNCSQLYQSIMIKKIL